MNFGGGGGVTFNINWSYVPNTEVSIKWNEVSNGFFVSSDRGISNDKFYADIIIEDTIANVQLVENYLYTNRNSSSIAMNAEIGEEIFGAELDYWTNPVTIAVLSKTPMQRINFSMASMKLKLLLTSTPEVLGTVIADTDLTSLLYPHEYKGDRKFQNILNVTQDTTVHASDRGHLQYLFDCTFSLVHEEMQSIRNFLIHDTTNGRAKSFVLQDPLAVKPFGSSVSAPYTVKVIDWKESGRDNLSFWGITLTLLRVQ